jgi:acyl carrier protein
MSTGELPHLRRAILGAMSGGQAAAAEPVLRRESSARTLGHCRHLVVDFLRKHIDEVSEFASRRSPEPGQSLADLGLDSMTVMEMRDRLMTALEVQIPPQIFIGDSTLEQIAERALDCFLLTGVVQPERPSAGPDDDSEELTL